MATAYTKLHLTVAEQVELLRSRGMHVPDPELAMRTLSVVGYYRLSGYWYPYRILRMNAPGREDRFVESATFDQVIGLYDFDRRLKLLLLDALERIEIAMRFRVGYILGRRGAYAHLDPANLDGSFTRAGPGGQPSSYQEWLDKLLEAQRRSREDFVEHFRSKYDGRLPVWVATEILDFGALSFLYGGLQRADRDEIAKQLVVVDGHGAGNGRALADWMHVLNYLRNVCAHHSRLWNRNLARQLSPRRLAPISPLRHLQAADPAQLARVFSVLSVVAFLLDQVSPGQTWTGDVARLVIESLPLCERHPSEMGFPDDWRTLPLWSIQLPPFDPHGPQPEVP